MTNGRGCDVILNSLSGDKLQASLRCLAMRGRFLEIGKNDLSNNTPLGMAKFLQNIDFQGILLDEACIGYSEDWDRAWKLLNDGIKEGVVRPLDTTLFRADEIEEAVRYMAQGKHIGKIVVQVGVCCLKFSLL